MTIKLKGLPCTGAMVNALLNTKVGSWPAEPIDATKAFKCQMRSLMKPQPEFGQPIQVSCSDWETPEGQFKCPHPVGSLIYVKETFGINPECGGKIYRADRGGDYQGMAQGYFKWKSSASMPHYASRITLEVMRVRVEKICDITPEDCKSEGVQVGGTKWDFPDIVNDEGYNRAIQGVYKDLIESINGPDAWDKWGWVFDVKRIK